MSGGRTSPNSPTQPAARPEGGLPGAGSSDQEGTAWTTVCIRHRSFQPHAWMGGLPCCGQGLAAQEEDYPAVFLNLFHPVFGHGLGLQTARLITQAALRTPAAECSWGPGSPPAPRQLPPAVTCPCSARRHQKQPDCGGLAQPLPWVRAHGSPLVAARGLRPPWQAWGWAEVRPGAGAGGDLLWRVTR